MGRGIIQLKNEVWGKQISGVIRFLGMGESESRKGKKAPKPKKPGSTSRLADLLGNMSAYINRQLFRAAKVGLYQLVRAFHLDLNLSGIYGFDDPSWTGVTVGLIAALNRGNQSVELYPDFTREVVDIRGKMSGWVIPGQLVVIVIGFLFRKPVRAIWWPKIKIRRKKKEAVKYA